jgi:hypothetical protein
MSPAPSSRGLLTPLAKKKPALPVTKTVFRKHAQTQARAREKATCMNPSLGTSRSGSWSPAPRRASTSPSVPTALPHCLPRSSSRSTAAASTDWSKRIRLGRERGCRGGPRHGQRGAPEAEAREQGAGGPRHSGVRRGAWLDAQRAAAALGEAALLAPRQAGVVLAVSLCCELSCRGIVEAKLTVLYPVYQLLDVDA